MLAVAEMDYVDTSGEVIDQSADHRRRLREFEAALRSDLAASGKLAKPCWSARQTPARWATSMTVN